MHPALGSRPGPGAAVPQWRRTGTPRSNLKLAGPTKFAHWHRDNAEPSRMDTEGRSSYTALARTALVVSRASPAQRRLSGQPPHTPGDDADLGNMGRFRWRIHLQLIQLFLLSTTRGIQGAASAASPTLLTQSQSPAVDNPLMGGPQLEDTHGRLCTCPLAIQTNLA